MAAIRSCIAIVIGAVLICESNGENYTPIVIWHGMGDSCCFPFSIGAISEKLNESLPGVQILSLKIGENVIDDVKNGYFMHPDEQIRLACDVIKQTPGLQDGFNALGFSQGGQFLRGLVQKCPGIRVKSLVSIGGQHQGIYGLPNCGSLTHSMCDYVRRLLNYAAYFSWVQKELAQATYWHDPLDEQAYRDGSTFLADLNNEKQINQTYIDRLLDLEHFVLIKFEGDTIVQPKETEWFGFYEAGQARKVQTMVETRLFKEDRLGLKTLMEDGRLHFLATPGNHLKFQWDWFEENVINVYLDRLDTV